MISQKKIQITTSGYSTLKSELDELVNKKRPRMVRRLENAREAGDLTENSDYLNAKDELEFLDGRIDELKHVIDNAQVIKSKSAKKASKVSVGTKVTVGIGRKKTIFDIVGEWEADPANKRISHESPLGKALVGKKVGDEAEVKAPAGKVVYKILSIG